MGDFSKHTKRLLSRSERLEGGLAYLLHGLFQTPKTLLMATICAA